MTLFRKSGLLKIDHFEKSWIRKWVTSFSILRLQGLLGLFKPGYSFSTIMFQGNRNSLQCKICSYVEIARLQIGLWLMQAAGSAVLFSHEEENWWVEFLWQGIGPRLECQSSEGKLTSTFWNFILIKSLQIYTLVMIFEFYG